MSIVIVDASVAAKWFFNEEHGADALAVLSGDNKLHAPDFLRLEMDSILCKWIRRGLISPDDGRDIRDTFRRYDIEYHPFAEFQDSAYMLASQYGRSVYDCLYVALAVGLKGRMVTADRRLYEAFAEGPVGGYVGLVGETT